MDELKYEHNCTYDYQTVAGALDSYPVVSASHCFTYGSSTPTVASSTVPSYQDIAFFWMVTLFLLAFIPAGFFASIFKRDRNPS